MGGRLAGSNRHLTYLCWTRGPLVSLLSLAATCEARLRRQEVRLHTAAGGRTAVKRAMNVLLVTIVGGLVSLGSSGATALADNSPVITESFESGSDLPTGWKFIQYVSGNSTATIVSGEAADGTHFLQITSTKPNHARVVLPVHVTPHASYQFHAMVRARGANGNTAAVLGTEGQYTVTQSVRTDTRWQPLNLYIKTGAQTTIDMNMGLGYFGQLNVGTADFDAVTVTQVNAIPGGATVADLTTPPAAQAKPQTAAGSTFSQGPNMVIWVFVGVLVVVGIGAAVFLMRRSEPDPTPERDTEPGKI